MDKKSNTLTFGLAMHALKRGCTVARKSWNKNMWVVYRKGYSNGRPYNTQTAATWYLNEKDYLQLRLPDDSYVTWAPSASDALAEDWLIVE